ncbi:HAMP domain-containing histidine kinase [Sphingomonas parva]|uniref:HAMP domain-containing histidine kinase n=1 Tax=Sphingomonas parva TaxID=2555898 RepID=A0A4Y8ZNM8_9SPHN|nr:HAMP domain-containing histidine kinase [Sphingomonas parva]TFI56872.1 HAMP domain-containing histidine kinase [Sphingomonas parva]
MKTAADGAARRARERLEGALPDVQGADRQHVRMFVLSHLAGPLLGLSLCVFLLAAGFPHDYRLSGFAALVALFWVYPAALRATGRYRLLSLCSLEHLQLTILWATHAYGGLMSPFLLWLAVVPLLAFLYLSPSPRLWLALVAAMAANVALYLLVSTWLASPPAVGAADLSWLSVLSLACAAVYVGVMATNFGRVLSSRDAVERQAAAHQTAVAALEARLLRLREAGAAKSERLARLGEDATPPLAALQRCCQSLLAEEAERQGSADFTELRSIGEASHYLAEVVRDIALYSDVACGPQQLGRVDIAAILDVAAAEIRPMIADRAELIVLDPDRVSISTDGRLLASALVALGRHVAQMALGPRIECRVARVVEGGEQLVIEITDAGSPTSGAGEERMAGAAGGVSGRAGAYGLSLALARRICERLGGSLTSDPDARRRVHFRLQVPALA